MKVVNTIFLLTLHSCCLHLARALTGPLYFLVDIHIKDVQATVGAYALVIKGYHVVTVAKPFTKVGVSHIRVYPLEEAPRSSQSDRAALRTAGHSLAVQDILIHPRYQENKRLYNMALLKVNHYIWHVFRRQLYLAKPQVLYDQCFWHSITTEMELETLRVNDMDYEDCRDEFDKVKSDDVEKPEIATNMMCASYTRDVCTREFGFVIVCDQQYLVGIGIYGDTSCGKTRPFIAYEIAKFRDWLTVIKSASEFNAANVYGNVASVTIYNIIISTIVALDLY